MLRVVGCRVEGSVFIMKRVHERMLDGTLDDSEELAALFQGSWVGEEADSI